ncbi:MAG: TonB-dependent receptor, partial [Chitinophagaceae bacterium]|nr:TonB-dependent receptor [Chitinophagaceae bacterium]
MDNQVYIKNESPNANIQLISGKLDYFVISGHRFERINDEYFEVLQEGGVKGLAQYSKTLRQGFRAEDQLVFTAYNKYFIEKAGKLYPVKSIGSVLSFFGNKSDEIKKYLNNNNFNYRKNPEKSIAAAIGQYNTITNWTPPVKQTRINTHDTALTAAPKTNSRKNIKSLEENKLLEISNASGAVKDKVTLAGYIKDTKTGEPIVGATLSADSSQSGITTDQFGYYSLSLKPGRHTIKISYAGMKDTKRQVNITTDGTLDIQLTEQVASLKAVMVVAEKNSHVKNTQMSVERINIKTIKQVPVVFGEADVLRVVMTLPGVTSAGEASTGFNVRGGSVDQNLILFSDATIYNPSHLFGFFSAFNPDVVKGVELYKSSIPEKYGGRLSSVLDVSAREGNSKKISGVGGIGPLTSKLAIEGPLFRSKKENAGTTFILGGRTTYSNWILKALPNESYRNSKASFYDLNLNVNSSINSRNSIYLTGYMSSDKFRLNTDTTYSYGNKNANIKWKHIFNNKLYAVFTTGYDHYEYAV